MTKRPLIALVAALTFAAATARADVSPSEWRAQQRAAAEKSEKILRQVEKIRGLLVQYQVMRSAYQADSQRAFRLIFGQYLSWHQTYLGLYTDARSSFSIKQDADKDDAPSPLDAHDSAKSALETIPELAKDSKAIFINEAHSSPVTRTLTVQLLTKLREKGFNYFAAETLYETDKDLAKRGYPTAESGYYTQEPIYAEIVRTALKLGFKVVAYEAISEATGDEREREQARNVYERVFRHDPNARLVLNAGYAHIAEAGKYLDGKSMAQHFRSISGIDPFTVEQTMMIEHSKPIEDHPYYRATISALHPTAPIVFLDNAGKPWSLKPGYDVSVVFPADVMHDGRPTWLTLGGMRVPYPIAGDLCHNELPCLVEARYVDEGDDAIPADRYVLGRTNIDAAQRDRMIPTVGDTRADLYLKPGRYKLSAVGLGNQALASRNIIVNAESGAP